MSWLSKRLKALRAFSFPVSILPVFVAVAAVRSPGQWQWDILILSGLGAALLHAGGNLLNDYFDFLSGVDKDLQDDPDRPGRLLTRGELGSSDVLKEAAVCLLLVLPIGLYLLWRCGAGLLIFAGIAVVGLYFYTGPPLKLKYRALGEPLVFLVFGPTLMLGAAYAQTGAFEVTALLLSIPVGLATTAILTANNLRDQNEDSLGGIVTLAQVIGIRALSWFYILLVAGSVVALAGLGIAGVGPIWLVLAPVLLVFLIRPLSCVWRRERLADIDARTAKFETVLLVFLLVSLILQNTIN